MKSFIFFDNSCIYETFFFKRWHVFSATFSYKYHALTFGCWGAVLLLVELALLGVVGGYDGSAQLPARGRDVAGQVRVPTHTVGNGSVGIHYITDLHTPIQTGYKESRKQNGHH